MRRLIAILVVALLAAPGTWWRTPLPALPRQPSGGGRWELSIRPVEQGAAKAGEAEVTGAWRLISDYPGFGSYSALAPLGGGRLLAASDTGRMLAFSPPGARPSSPEMGAFAGRDESDKVLVDIESLTRDPASGRLWVGYEGSNAIERFEADFGDAERVRPLAMRNWPSNSGPETVLRLADGRFLVVSEGRQGWRGGRHPALLFRSDPVEGAESIEFFFVTRDGFRPVDAKQLPDGRVLVLLRRFDWFPPAFRNRIVLADPATIAAGGEWRGRIIAGIEPPLPTENYEGLALEPAVRGAVDVWLISDDNQSVLQRTLLLRLRWDPSRD